MRFRPWWIGLLLLLGATPAAAQLCQGRPPYAVNPYQVGGAAAFGDRAKEFGGDFGVGGRYLFATAGFTSKHVDTTDSTGTAVSGRVGAELPVDRTRRIFFCPSLFLSFGSGPDDGAIDVSTFRVGGGGRVGVGVYDSGALMVVPTFGIDVLRERLAFETGGIEEEDADGVGIASIGVGFIINQQFAITPELRVPFSAADSDVTVSLRFAIAFQGARRP